MSTEIIILNVDNVLIGFFSWRSLMAAVGELVFSKRAASMMSTMFFGCVVLDRN